MKKLKDTITEKIPNKPVDLRIINTVMKKGINRRKNIECKIFKYELTVYGEVRDKNGLFLNFKGTEGDIKFYLDDFETEIKEFGIEYKPLINYIK